MFYDKLRVGAYPAEGTIEPFEDTWMTYDPDRFRSFFPNGGGTLSGRVSENGQYLTCWREHERELFDERLPAGMCIAKDGTVVRVVERSGLKVVVPADDGTIAALERTDETDRLLLFSPEGTESLNETFESNVSTVTISPGGEHVAVATAFPDNAVHLYQAVDGLYLGRRENPKTSVLGELRFGEHESEQVVETYEISPDSDLDVHENRTQVIDRIPLEPQLDVQALTGVCIVENAEDGEFHFVPESALDDVVGQLRIPGVEVDAACGRCLKPIEATVIYYASKQAFESRFGFCEGCLAASAKYPEAKTEKVA